MKINSMKNVKHGFPIRQRYSAIAAFAEDKANGVDHGDTEPITADDCTAFDEAPLYCIGEAEPDNYECYHNFYAVFPISVR